MPMLKNLEAGKGYVIDDIKCVQKTGIYVPNDIFATELAAEPQ